ncbi:unnamed protein product [Cyclocybe aegerita]|uniref:FAD/NAD(P)-binding domain-containing protein n=1 Tax=Cyclocybe aegerita TaxID=1973307 RepID=A0A8S0WDQ7_CYCAE|nr:unnamed protein product [Cyclocybe aegerita]
MPGPAVLSEAIGIVGAGVAGLISAHVLLKDGFTDITLISRDKSVGGTWARHRVYPGLYINNVHGEYRLSGLEMPLPENAARVGGRLSGTDMCEYMEKYSATFLEGKVKFMLQTEVLDISRNAEGKWSVRVENAQSRAREVLAFSRIILATGGCSNPKIPAELSPRAAEDTGYKGLVIHSSQFASRLDDILAAVKPRESEDTDDEERVLVIGGGKSSQDICTKLAIEGRKVTMVFDTTDVFLGTASPLPDFLRKSRFLAVLSGYCSLNTRLERFLHTTSIGSAINHFIWRKLGESSFDAFQVPQNSPLRRTHPMFWGIRLSDDGNYRPDCFHALVNTGAIDIISPARVEGYSKDGKSLVVSDGTIVSPKAVLLATGYQSSWSDIFATKMAEELGINRHAPHTTIEATWDNYKSLKNPPALKPEHKLWTTSIYRGIVPAKNIERRDFAIAGALFSANLGYTNEVVAHWIASYFRGDKMHLPTSAEEAIAKAEEKAHWMKVRFPDMVSWVNESYSTSFDFWSWPQAADELLNDMYLPGMRSGGNWLNWVFKVIDLKEIENLTDEREIKQKELSSLQHP